MHAAFQHDLLIEIAKLLRKFGHQAFHTLADELSSPTFTATMPAVLRAVAGTANATTAASNKASAKPRDYRSTLCALGETDAKKSAALVRIYDDLTAGALLPSLRDVRRFAEQNGLPKVKASSRAKAITPLVKSLSAWPLNRIRTILNNNGTTPPEGDRSYAGWCDIILHGGR
ncbi:MAG TPA: hypothetical protein VND64_20060 [Pirellulales bacterium]|nr:hypothetical protein [Pirellulales bacterium]